MMYLFVSRTARTPVRSEYKKRCVCHKSLSHCALRQEESYGRRPHKCREDLAALTTIARYPTLVYDWGRYRTWHPDFTLPSYNGLIVEYAGMSDRPEYMNPYALAYPLDEPSPFDFKAHACEDSVVGILS